MRSSSLKKSSFTLPPDEVKRVNRLKKRMGLKSNTAVVRKALSDLESKIDQDWLRKEYERASRLVRDSNQNEMKEWDLLCDEGLD